MLFPMVFYFSLMSSAYSNPLCTPQQWATRLNFTARVGELRCCVCFGTPDECKMNQPSIKPFPGCAEDVRFSYNSDKLTIQAKATLKNFAKSLPLMDRHDFYFSLNGHTDAVGSNKFNLSLSKRRADRVRRSLVELRVKAKFLQIKVFGATVPKQGATSAAELRRVEIRLERVGDGQ